MNLIVALVIGTSLGAALGYYGKCTSGTCPLTANPWRGALYGAVLGLLFYAATGGGGSKTMQATPNVKLLDAARFDGAVLQAANPVVVDFYATWCGPCKQLAPVLNDLAGQYQGRVQFFKVDVDQSGDLARRFEVEGVPTMLFFKEGKAVDRVVGFTGKGALQQKLELLAGSGQAR